MWAKQSAVYDCLVPFDEKITETSLMSLDVLQLLLDRFTVLCT